MNSYCSIFLTYSQHLLQWGVVFLVTFDMLSFEKSSNMPKKEEKLDPTLSKPEIQGQVVSGISYIHH